MIGAPSDARLRRLISGAEAPLGERYTPEALRVFDSEERSRFLDSRGRPLRDEAVVWELLYRIEPALYARLVAGERLHEGILDWLPSRCGRVLEIGAGAGRLTLDLAPRCERLVAIEPAAGLRGILERRLRDAGAAHAVVRRGFFDDLTAAEAEHDLVISCSAFTARDLADPARCLEAMESRCAPGALLVLVWPGDAAWLAARGFRHEVFEGPMVVEYESVDEAIALARIFYPDAVAEIARRGSRFVDPAILGFNPPRDLCWKRHG